MTEEERHTETIDNTRNCMIKSSTSIQLEWTTTLSLPTHLKEQVALSEALPLQSEPGSLVADTPLNSTL